MPSVQLVANMNSNPEKACADLSVIAQHLIGYQMTLQSINVSGPGNVTVTYTGGNLTATQKEHLGLA